MTELVKAVRGRLSETCFVKRMRREGCAVSLKGAPRPNLIVDLDKPGAPLGPQDKRCDYLFFADGNEGPGWVVVLELKRGSLSAGEIIRQLRAGAVAAEEIVPEDEPVNFRPVAVSGGGTRKAEWKKLKDETAKIRFHGRPETVRFIGCGEQLTRVLCS